MNSLVLMVVLAAQVAVDLVIHLVMCSLRSVIALLLFELSNVTSRFRTSCTFFIRFVILYKFRG
jgi:hypothetical protein